MPKKILIFSLAYYPRFVGGAEIAIKEITERISPQDIQFHLVCLRFDSALPREERIGNVLVHRVGFGKAGAVPNISYGLLWLVDKMLFVPLAALKGLRLHRIHRFDGLWAMMTYMVLPVVLLRLLGVRLPYVLTLQDGDPFEHVFKRRRIRPFLPLLRYGFRHAAIIQTISNFLAQWPRVIGFTGSIAVVPNGTESKRFISAAPADIGKKEGEVALVTTSRLVPKNAVDDCIRALALLPPHIVFVVIGSGPEEPALRALARTLAVEGRVRFLGAIDNQQLPSYLHASDIFIRPSRSEGMGISFIEAMAAGLPVIATQEGGIADFLFDAKRNPEHPTTGWAVERDSPQEIAQAVKDIVSNPDRTKKVVETARHLALEKYDWQLIARDMREKVFSRLFT